MVSSSPHKRDKLKKKKRQAMGHKGPRFLTTISTGLGSRFHYENFGPMGCDYQHIHIRNKTEGILKTEEHRSPWPPAAHHPTPCGYWQLPRHTLRKWHLHHSETALASQIPGLQDTLCYHLNAAFMSDVVSLPYDCICHSQMFSGISNLILLL